MHAAPFGAGVKCLAGVQVLVRLKTTGWTLGALRRFKRKKIPQRWKVAFLEGIDEYIHPPKFQKLAIGGF